MPYTIDQLYSFAAEVERILSSSAVDEAIVLLIPYLSNDALANFTPGDDDPDAVLILEKLKEVRDWLNNGRNIDARKDIAKDLKALLTKRSVKISLDRVLIEPAPPSKPAQQAPPHEPIPFPDAIPAPVSKVDPALNQATWTELREEANAEFEREETTSEIRKALQDYGTDSLRRDLAKKIVAVQDERQSQPVPDAPPEGLSIDQRVWKSIKETIISDRERKGNVEQFAKQLSNFGTDAEARDWAKKLSDLIEKSSPCKLAKPILDSLSQLQQSFADGFPGDDQEGLMQEIGTSIQRLNQIVAQNDQAAAATEFASAVGQLGKLVKEADMFLERERLTLEVQMQVLERKREKPSLVSPSEFKTQLKDFRSRIETDVEKLLERLKVEQKNHLDNCQTKLQIAIEAKAIEAGHLLITPSNVSDNGIPVGQVAYTFQQKVTKDLWPEGIVKDCLYKDDDEAKFAEFAKSLNTVIESESGRLTALCDDQPVTGQPDTAISAIDVSAFFNPVETIKRQADNLGKIKKLIPIEAAVENFTRANGRTFLELLKSAAAMPARTLGLLFVVFAPFVLLGFGNFGKDLTKSFGRATQLDPLVGISTILLVLAFFVTTALVKLRFFNRTSEGIHRVYQKPFFIPWGIAAFATLIGFAILSLLFQWFVANPLSNYCADYSDDWHKKASTLKTRIEEDLTQNTRDASNNTGSEVEAKTAFKSLGEKTFYRIIKEEHGIETAATTAVDFEKDAFIVNKNAVLLYDRDKQPIVDAVKILTTTYTDTNYLESQVNSSRNRYLSLEGSDYWKIIEHTPKVTDTDNVNSKWEWLKAEKLKESDSYLFVLRRLNEFYQKELPGNDDPNVKKFGTFLTDTMKLSKEEVEQKYREVWIKDELIPAYRDALRNSLLRYTAFRNPEDSSVLSEAKSEKDNKSQDDKEAAQNGNPSKGTNTIDDGGKVEFEKTIDAFARFVPIKGWTPQTGVSIVGLILFYGIGVLVLLFGLAWQTSERPRSFSPGFSLATVAALLLVSALGLSVWSTVSKVNDDAAKSYAELLADKGATQIHVPSRTWTDYLTFNLSADYAPQVPDPNQLLPLEKRVYLTKSQSKPDVASTPPATTTVSTETATPAATTQAAAPAAPTLAPPPEVVPPQPKFAKPVSISDSAPAFTFWLSLSLGLVLIACYWFSWRAYQRSLDYKKTEANQFFKTSLLAAVQKGIGDHIASQEREVRETLQSVTDIKIRTHEFELEKRFERACNSVTQGRETLSNQITILKKRLEVPGQVATKLEALKKAIEKAT